MEIFNQIYEAVKKRGLITEKTKDIDFYKKLTEEINEVRLEMVKKNNDIQNELIDVMTVCSSWLIHRGFDVDKLLIENAVKNENRAKVKK